MNAARPTAMAAGPPGPKARTGTAAAATVPAATVPVMTVPVMTVARAVPPKPRGAADPARRIAHRPRAAAATAAFRVAAAAPSAACPRRHGRG